MNGQEPSAVPLLSQPVWLQLPQATRSKLVNLFGLKRSGATETYMGRDSMVRVVSDGYTAADLLAVTTSKMQELLGTDSKDFYGLFDEVLANIDALLDGTFLSVEEVEIKGEGVFDKETGEPVTTHIEVSKPKRKYTKKAK